MFYIFICVYTFLAASGAVEGRLWNLQNVPDGLKIYSVVATWEEAYSQCLNEGLILASPVDNFAFDTMKTIISSTGSMFYTGMKASEPSHYVSVEGIPLENMTLGSWQELDPYNGDCLAMSVNSLRVVPCETRLPYMCYNPHVFNSNKKNCGLNDRYEYKYDVPTGKCYKVHKEVLTWEKAQLTCVSEGANLVVIDNDKELESIKNIYGSTSWIWIGLHDYTGKADWLSVHWQPVEELFNTWLTGYKPSDCRCGTLQLPNHLNRAHCNRTIDFICEKEPTY